MTSHLRTVDTNASSIRKETSVPFSFLEALPPSLLQQMEQVAASPKLNMQRVPFSSVLSSTPTEEASCSCSTCGSTCCDRV